MRVNKIQTQIQMLSRLTVSELFCSEEPTTVGQNCSISSLFFTDHFIYLIDTSNPNTLKKISSKNFETSQFIELPFSVSKGKIKSLTEIKNLIILVLQKCNELLYISQERQCIKLSSHFEPINKVICYRSEIATCSDDFTVRIWSLQSGNIVQSQIKHAYFGHTGKVTCLQTYQNILVSGSNAQQVIFWQNDQIHCKFKSNSSIKNLLKCSQSNQFLVFSQNGEIFVLNLKKIAKNRKIEVNRVIKYLPQATTQINNYFKHIFEIDDSFILFNDNNQIVFVEINLGEIIIKKNLSQGNEDPIVNMNSIGRMLLFGKAKKSISLLRF